MKKSGFTLIELSIVLVIIGLIVGGVLVGKDLISAAEIRAAVSQMEKYQTAVNTFRLKYNYLPGDIPEPTATSVGLTTRVVGAGQYDTGNSDGLITGAVCFRCTRSSPLGNEATLFWVDLSSAQMIDGNFSINLANTTVAGGNNWPTQVGGTYTAAVVDTFFPRSKLGNGSYVYVWTGGWIPHTGTTWHQLPGNSKNYLTISGVGGPGTDGDTLVQATITANQAYNIDTKADDGMPQTGKITALYPLWNPWSTATGANGDHDSTTNGPVSLAGDLGNSGLGANSSITCYEPKAGMEQYATWINNGTGLNCALSFEMK